ncbi:DEAD/DEAH box helicase family protein [Methanobacterium sp. YSL]|nr:DEAD/DEAH box helicase family protein [Methanobacterium sp. YSL]
MGLKNLNLKFSYDSDSDDVLNDFYIPSLSESVIYLRLSGYFTSNSLAISSRGISNFIKNGGEMKLITGATLDEKDIDIIKKAKKDPQKVIEESMIKELDNLEEGLVKDHVMALGWMLAKNKLEIKIAIPSHKNHHHLNTIFHQKIGILEDSEGNSISFSGSNNETVSGWIANVEEFKVFRNWNKHENEYLKADLIKFKNYWEGKSERVEVMDIPTAVKKRLIKMAPSHITINYPEKKLSKRKAIKLWDYQEKAIKKWVENSHKGIFEMATGTGKTFTALGCLKKEFETSNKVFSLITCPYQHLVQQWRREVDNFGFNFDKVIIADSSNRSWKDDLVDSLIDISIGDKNKLLVLTTHRTFASTKFIEIIKKYKECPAFLIADEVHGLGAEISLNGLISDYDKRLGLSATPERWFDEFGTNEIYEYFGGVVFQFSLSKAINSINPATEETYLTPYKYLPNFISLDNEELEEYLEISKSIAFKFASSKHSSEEEKRIQGMLFKRANIIKNAHNKYEALERILDEIGQKTKWIIVYCSNEQIDKVMGIMNKRRIKAHRFTMSEGTKSESKYKGDSEREYLIKKFASGDYECLVAMKCLDEGVDIPPARVAILMASSGNPREYIQRIGRVIRRYEGKKEAIIHDLIAIPSLSALPSQIKNVEREIFRKEEARYMEIAKIASNNAEALKMLYEIKNRIGGYF